MRSDFRLPHGVFQDVLRTFSAEPRLSGADGGPGAVGYLELAEDVGDVVLDGLEAEEQLPGYLGVGPSAGDKGEDLTLPFRQLREGWRAGGLLGGKEAHHPPASTPSPA
jgi:hypothetical protein